jgi:hypothetical protein
MDTQQFMDTLTTEAQDNLNFARSEGRNGDSTKENAASAALDGFAAQVAMTDYVAMMTELGVERNNFGLVVQVAAALK